MKVGISTHGSRWGENKYKVLKSCGFDCFDFNTMGTESEIYTSSESELKAILKKERELAEDAGITIWQTHGPWRCPPLDFTTEDRAERFEKMQRSILACYLLGAKYWVIHPLMPYDTDDLKDNRREETFEINYNFFSKLIKTAEDYDITICIENMPMTSFSIAKPEEILNLVKAINSEKAGICLDTGHVNVFPELSLHDEVLRIKDYLKVLHVHDNDGKLDYHQLPYYGTIDWSAFGKALKDINFNGVFSFETAPTSNLPSPIYEDTFALMVKTAKHIIG
jgi:sugar phosphate isomerase/epimerase